MSLQWLFLQVCPTRTRQPATFRASGEHVSQSGFPITETSVRVIDKAANIVGVTGTGPVFGEVRKSISVDIDQGADETMEQVGGKGGAVNLSFYTTCSESFH